MKPLKITARHPLGFVIEFEFEDGDDVNKKARGLAKLGYTSPTNGDDWRRTPEGLPICPIHGEVMVKREKQGDEWHSHKVTDPVTGELCYCRGYKHHSATGWQIAPNAEPEPAPEQPKPKQVRKPQRQGKTVIIDQVAANSLFG